jgi:hypothetical protein
LVTPLEAIFDCYRSAVVLVIHRAVLTKGLHGSPVRKSTAINRASSVASTTRLRH